MITKKLEEAINEQINFEFYSAYIYLAMSAWLNDQNMNGFSHWMQIQAREETFHAMKLFNYIHDRGGHVRLQSIKQPELEWKSFLDVFKHAHQHEQTVTSRFSNLTDLAMQERDHVTTVLLQWFITEQIEEEATVRNIVDQLSMIGESKDSIFMLDRELNQRQVSPMVAAFLTGQPLPGA